MPDTELPTMVTNLQVADTSSNSVTLIWNPAPDNYRVIISEPESGKEKQVSGLDTASPDFEEIVIRL